MITLKEVIHYPDTNSVEATWVNRTVTPAQGIEGEEGYQPEKITEAQVKCHSYDQTQMDMLEADLGADAAEYAELIANVRDNQLPTPPVPNPRIDQIKAELIVLDAKKIRPLATGDTAFLADLNVQSDMLRAELQGLASD